MGAVGTLVTINERLKNSISINDAVEFLQKLWLYTSLLAQCYSIVTIVEKARYKHFCLDDYGDYPTLFSKLRRYLEKALPNLTS